MELKQSTKFAVGALICAVLWVASGLVFKGKEKKENYVISEDKPKSVRIINSKAKLITAEFSVSGHTIADSSVVIKSEVKGTVDKIIAKDGAFVKEGDVIIKLKEDDRKAKIAEAKARLDLKKLEYSNYSSLVAGGFSTKVKKIDSLSSYESAKADLLTAELNYEKSIIKAPFSGYLDEIKVKKGDFLDVGSVVTKIIKLDPIQISAYVPEKYISSVEIGEKAVIERKDYNFDARVSFISKSALQQTRAFLVKLTSPNPDGKVPEGITVKLEIPLKKTKAHSVNSSTLTLNEMGDVGVKVIGEDGKVKFYKVEIIKEDANGAVWVSGIPDTAKIITVGQEYVVEGEKINNIVEGKL